MSRYARRVDSNQGGETGLTADELELARARRARVRSAIGTAIVAWLEALGRGNTFHAFELRAYVAVVCGGKAPASTDRILRALRADGVVHYEVLSRRDSLYRLTWVAP